MLRIAIVDDRAEDRQELMKGLHEEMKVWNTAYEITEFASGEAFLSSQANHQFKIVFLDIFMNGISGIDVAKQLTNNCKIIFLTTSVDYIAKSFALDATCYLLKPLDYDNLHQAISLCFPRLGDGSVLRVPVDKTHLVIDRDEIIYIDFMKRCTRVHTMDNTLNCYVTFSELVAPLMDDMRFVACRRGVLINMKFISKAIDSDFILTNGEKIPISRNIKKNVLKTFHRYKLDTM